MRAFARLFFLFRPFLFLVLLVPFLFVVSPASAQTSSYMAPNTTSEVPQNLHTYSQNIVIDVMAAMICQMTGIDPVNSNQACLGVDRQSGKIGFVKNGGGAIGLMGNLIVATYTPPIRSGEYYQYMANNFGIAKPAYAQSTCTGGYGFCSLSPIFVLWDRFKNLTYLIFIILFVLVGLAIMFRVKIDQRTTMSIENQIPKIIIALLLITFTLPIAGLLIDLMWTSTYLVANVLSPITTDAQFNTATIGLNIFQNPIGFSNELFKQHGPAGRLEFDFGGLMGVARGSGYAAQETISSMFAPNDFKDTFKLQGIDQNQCHGFDPGCWVGQVAGASIGTILSQIVGWTISWLVGILAVFIVTIALLFALFRLWLELIKAYLFLLIDIVLSPFWVAVGLIPGGPIDFEKWIREMLSNLIPFPATIALLLLGKAFMQQFAAGVKTGTPVFVPPLIGNPIGNGNLQPIGAIIGLGMILLTPQIVQMIKDLLKPPTFKYTPGILQPLEAGAAPVTGAVAGGWQRIWKVDYAGGATGPAAVAAFKIAPKLANFFLGARYPHAVAHGTQAPGAGHPQ